MITIQLYQRFSFLRRSAFFSEVILTPLISYSLTNSTSWIRPGTMIDSKPSTSAFYKALPRSRQCFLAGPHNHWEIELGKHWRGTFRFVQTDYRTVTVNVFDRSAWEDRLQALLNDLLSVGEESSIIFTATPGSASALMEELVAAGVNYPSELSNAVGEWICQNYHSDWPLAKGATVGIAVHHGRIPRALGQLFVQLFDKGAMKTLICTSTLIEGVNTSAANVFIYDKKINRTDFDFFSFSNIRGRVGRMMRHFVGRAFLYHEASRRD